VIRDIQDPANAKTLCRFDPAAQSPQFVIATQVAYPTSGRQIIKVDLSAGTATVLATVTFVLAPGQLSFSPDGSSFTYLDGDAWHLVTPTGNRVLTTLPPVPARGLNPDEDDSFLSYSPDGLYIALVQTLHTGGTGQTAPLQVRKASDGTLVYSTAGMTMGVWASVPSRLFFRDAGGSVHRWDPTTGASTLLPLKWIRPKSSPDGRWIAYTLRTNNVDGVGYYSVQSNSVAYTSPPARSKPRFLTNDLVWYIGEKPCDTCFGGLPTPTGLTYIYSIAGLSEVVSRLSDLLDVWPRIGGPPAGVG
jgi:Tol biopolymer transport system component